MKKYVAALAALAVVGTAGVVYLSDKIEDTPTDSTTTTTTSSYSQSYDSSTTKNSVTVDKTEEESTTSTTKEDEKEYTFDAEIDSVSGDVLILIPDKNSDVAKSADKITVGLKNVKTVDKNGKSVKSDDVKNFSDITITYDGTVMETYPAQVKATKAVLKNRTDCNVYFCLDDGKVIDVITIPVGSDLESADMPNAGAYCPDGYHFEGWLSGSKVVYGIADIQDSMSLTAKIRKD